jgi:conjugal transfer pilus assembly protein TrbC
MGSLPAKILLLMLQLILFLALTVMLFPSLSRAQDKLPVVGSIPGVDNSRLQQQIDVYQKELQDLKKGRGGMKIILPTKEQLIQGKKEAAKAMEAFRSEKMQQEIRAEETRVLKKNEPKTLPNLLIRPVDAPLQQHPTRPAGETVYVFLSSSMPDQAVHTYISRAALYGEGGIVPVFYGFPGGLANKVQAGSYFAHMMQKDLVCKDRPGSQCSHYKVRMLINPDVFKKFGVSVVPTVVFATAKSSWRMEGDMSLGYMLSRMNKLAHSRYLARVVKQLKGENL